METNEQVPMVHFSDNQNARYVVPQINPGEKTASDSRLFVLRRRESSPATKEVV